MSMLADPKRKQKFGPDPRNTFWSNDESKFGFRMLESMGWKKGKGLGLQESGRTELVKAEHRKNTDARGLGCSRKHADNWIAHQDDFNAILASLNNNSDQPDTSSKPLETTEALVSLEEKSKSSRSRVHYHKFTREKDLSSRSADDLNCIFGRRKRASSDKATPISQSKASSEEDSSSDNQDNNNNNSSLDKDLQPHGVKTVTSSSSVQEYFAMKMAELKRKREASAAEGVNSNCDGQESENSSDEISKVAEITASSKNENINVVPTSEPLVAKCEDSVAVEKHTRKKKKKKETCEEEAKDVEFEGHLADEFQNDIPVDTSPGSKSACEENQLSKSKKKEKRKKKTGTSDCVLDTSSLSNSLEEPTVESETANQEQEPPARKTKKRKSAEPSLSDSALEQPSEDTDLDGEESLDAPSRKKKKKKKKSKEAETETESHNSSILRQENDGKTRRRKSVRFSTGEIEVFLIPNKEDEKLQQEKEEALDKKSSRKRKRQKANVEKEASANEEQETLAPTAETEKGEIKDSQALTEEEDYIPLKKKRKLKNEEKAARKKTSKALEENQDVQQEQPAESDPSAQPGMVDDTTNMASQEKEAESSVSSAFPEKMRSKARKIISQEQVDSICKLFVDSNLSSVKGYGNV